jgi:hypothetical protein
MDSARRLALILDPLSIRKHEIHMDDKRVNQAQASGDQA